ncbi:MAG: hypothetical protein LBG28_04855 [Tannerella sp.]|nr:hypothetical protein [Tannerella sp.]
MKIKSLVWMILLFPSFFSSCNREEGLGGSSSLTGYVYKIVHSDDDYTFASDTFPAEKKDVYLIFGDDADDYFGDDVETDKNGLYRFDYLRKGRYVVYAYSEYADGRREAVSQTVTVGNGLNNAETIYVHSGNAYGTAAIKGYVYARYYHNGNYRDEGPGTGMRAYIRKAGTEGFFDDVRVSDGVFIFQKLPPGEYEVAVESEDPDTERVDMIYSSPVVIDKTEQIYIIPETIRVYVAV